MPAEKKMSIETQKLLSFVTWDWQPMDSLLELALDGVPPGKALRKYQQRSAYEARTSPSQSGTRVRRELTEDEQIVSGARDILRGAIYSQAKSGRLEFRDVDGTRHVRFKERRVEAAATADGCCVTCRRPFPQATEQKPPPAPPQPRPKVVYPHFPAWQAEARRKGVS